MNNSTFIFYKTKYNRYSLKALLGAIEKYGLSENVLVEESIEEIKKIIKRNKKGIVLFSFPTTEVFNIELHLKQLNKLKKSFEIMLVAGGPHASGIPEQTLRMGFDIVVEGEGEEIVKDLLENPFDKKGKILKGKEVSLDNYPSFSKKFKIFGAIEITRGCPFMCAFCQTPRIFGITPRHRSIKRILEEVEIRVKWGKKDIRFITPNALGYGAKGKEPDFSTVEELLREIRKIGGKNVKIFLGTFPSEIRPDFVTQESARILKAYVDNDNITIGAQSGSDRMLEILRRGHGVKDVINAVKILRKQGFKVNVDFIFGFPEEKEKDAKESLKTMRLLIKMGARIHAHSFLPLPQTPLFGKETSPIPSYFLKEIENFISKGALFGQWKKQIQLGEKLCKYFTERLTS